jgi:acyl-CoA reductase-like NAD-dependent aldehyde dehydrogenase
VLTDVTTDMTINKEEIFGPVARLYRFKSEDEAVKMADDTEFGSPPTSTAATTAASGASRGPRIRHHRHQRGHQLDRDRAVRGMKESSIGRRGIEIRHRGIPRGQLPLHGGIDR